MTLKRTSPKSHIRRGAGSERRKDRGPQNISINPWMGQRKPPRLGTSMSINSMKSQGSTPPCYLFTRGRRSRTAHGGSEVERPCVNKRHPKPQRGRARSLAYRIGQEDVNRRSSSETLVAKSPPQPKQTLGILPKTRRCGRAFRPVSKLS